MSRTQETEHVYKLLGLSRSYSEGATEVNALKDVSLEINSGEFVVITGASGSGKSTLLQLLGGLDRPTAGELFFEGRELSKLGDRELTKLRLNAFGFIFQQFNLVPTLTAFQNVELALAPTGSSTSQRKQRVDELLGQVGLSERADHLPSQLSGGEQQRVAIARAIANNPRVLLADEPTGNLDSSTGKDILSLLHNLASGQQQTVIFITHDPEIAKSAPRLLKMQDGKLTR